MIKLTHTHSISKGFSRGLFEYSDFFQDHQLQPRHIGDVRRDYIQNCGLKLGLEKAVLIQVSYDQHKELQSFKTQRYENLEHCKSQLKAIFNTFLFLVMGKDKTWDKNAATSSDARD